MSDYTQGKAGKPAGVKGAAVQKPAGRRSKKVRPIPQPEEASGNMSGLGMTIKRNEFYRDSYRAMQRIAFFQSLIIIALIAAHFFVIKVHQPENRYFATTDDGRLVPMVPLREPNLSSPALLSWVAQAATEIMTFGFHDYENRLQESSRYFTTRGWDSFSTALGNSRIIEKIKDSQQVVTAAPRSAPIILQERIVNDRYEWIVQLPMKLTFQSGSKIETRDWLVTINVVRVPQLGNPNGLGIQQWIAQPG